MIYGFPFGSLSGDRKYGIAIWQKLLTKLVGSGVFMNELSDSFQVVPGTGMNIKIKTGFGMLDGIFTYSDADETKTCSSVLGSARDDLVVVKADYVNRDPVFVIKSNVSKTNGLYPVQRDGSAFEIALAVIHFQSNSSAVTADIIEDLRLDSNYCGVVQGLIQQVNTTTLYNQIQADLAEFKSVNEADFTAWFQSIQNIFDANAETNLLNLINARVKIDGTSEMTGDLKHGNHKSQYKDSLGNVIAEIEPASDGIKINAYAGATAKALYIKNDGTMTLNGHKVWTDADLSVNVGAPTELTEGSLYFEILE